MTTTLDETATGVFVVSVTPFTDSGNLDLESTDRLVDYYLACGVRGITLLGMMGEAQKLTMAESLTFIRRVAKRVNGAIPIVVGASSPGFAPMKELATSARGEGCAAAMIAPPSHLRTDVQIYGYFESVSETLAGIPFVLQDFPLVTNVQIAPAVLTRIIRDISTCVMLKHEDWPGLSKISALRKASDAGETRRISILAGNGGLFLAEELGRGADGAMTGFAYPEMMVSVCAAHAAGRSERARDLMDTYLPLMRYEQQPGVGLSVRKYVLSKRGLIGSAMVRKPGTPLSGWDVAEIDVLIERQNRRLLEIG
jgi:4-hydroxy-tetrahydrodipicolinate synthase